MSEQILTEEELKEIDRLNYTSLKSKSVDRLIASHMFLIQANAELSFKNMKYKEALETISEGIPPYAPITIISMKEHYEATATKALEVFE